MQIFVSRRVLYCGQPIGLIVGKNRQAAFQACDKVIVKYKNVKKPVLDIKESVKQQIESNTKVSANLAFPCRGITEKVAEEILNNFEDKAAAFRLGAKNKREGEYQETFRTVKGEFVTRGQYHFHMETQTCLCIPKEDGMDVYSSTQSMDNVQASISAALQKPANTYELGYDFKCTILCYLTLCALISNVLGIFLQNKFGGSSYWRRLWCQKVS